MTDSQWLSWFLYIEPWWLAPIRIFVYILFGIGVLIIGLAKRNIRYLFIGVAFLIGLILTIKSSHPDLRGFLEFNLLAVKLLYAFGALVIGIVLLIAARIILKRRNTNDSTAENGNKESV